MKIHTLYMIIPLISMFVYPFFCALVTSLSSVLMFSFEEDISCCSNNPYILSHVVVLRMMK